jgi:hypothetical protein
MSPAVSNVFDPLMNELVGIHARWALQRRVFDFEERRTELLNRVSATFFGYAQSAMYLDVILALCRYTDPAESGKKIGDRPNLTLDRLVKAVRADDATFGGKLETGKWDAVKEWRDDFFGEIRSKRIAHNDLPKMEGRFSGQPTDWPSREQVEGFLTRCTDLMDAVYQHFNGRQCKFDVNAQ